MAVTVKDCAALKFPDAADASVLADVAKSESSVRPCQVKDDAPAATLLAAPMAAPFAGMLKEIDTPVLVAVLEAVTPDAPVSEYIVKPRVVAAVKLAVTVPLVPDGTDAAQISAVSPAVKFTFAISVLATPPMVIPVIALPPPAV